MNANKIGSVIKARLLASNEVADLIKKEVHPIVAPTGTKFPFITYRRSGVTPSYTKDRKSVQDSATVDVTIHTDNYKQSMRLLEDVFNSLQAYSGIVEGIHVDEIRMINSEEDFVEDSYLQNLTFEIDVIND